MSPRGVIQHEEWEVEEEQNLSGEVDWASSNGVQNYNPPSNYPDDPEHPDRQVEWVTILRHGEQDREGGQVEEYSNLAGLVDSERYSIF